MSPTPSGTTSTYSNMLNEKTKTKRAKPKSFDDLRGIMKEKGISKATYSY